ncbi:hypothetical protein [Aurantivibrio plasticivorans]
MPAIAPEDVLFYIAERDMSIDQTLRALYNYPSEVTRKHFIAVNSHLKGNFIRAGQMVIVTPENPLGCTLWETQMSIAAKHIDSELDRLTAQERSKLAANYALLSNAAAYSGTMYGWTNTYFQQKKQHVERALKQIEQLYKNTYDTTGNLKGNNFFQQRRALFLQLDQTINGMLERQLFGYDVNANRIKSKLGLSNKAIVHQWNTQGGSTSIDGFKSNYTKLTNTARTFNRLGYVAIALDVTASAATIAEACAVEPDSGYCSRTKYEQTGRVVGSVGGGAVSGTLATYLTCNLLFGLETAGTSLLWCTILAGAAGGYGGSQLFGSWGEDAGSEIYHRTHSAK